MGKRGLSCRPARPATPTRHLPIPGPPCPVREGLPAPHVQPSRARARNGASQRGGTVSRAVREPGLPAGPLAIRDPRVRKALVLGSLPDPAGRTSLPLPRSCL